MALPLRFNSGAISTFRRLMSRSSCNGMLSRRANHQQASAPRQFKVTLDGETLYIEQPLAEALGWREGAPTEGIPLRLSGWSPHYFAITRKGTDADLLAHGTIESSRNPSVIATLEYLKKTDSE
ncbi:hypothetical protein BKA70DRAFT_1397346 [Coprinopsis sp. MPI-PUGE-AT-0042]|nr:hypothetical protein BKA70DRAFT_1397346 [Coprinopsis sp. MPI-PUGE-AT-0042]